ncbi:IS66 family transposase [Deinococcus ruber]|uniref:IS66 family transposase n=1 Tax=Deinococcus ruber TaxID=1848197 RepID=UPI001E424A38|nr:transposase [Deinococcus ruber]
MNRAPLKSNSNERLRLGILKQDVLDRVWRFLKDRDIPPTNNAAEQSLRTVVMTRKVSQGSKTAAGAQTYMWIKFMVETARLRGQDPVAILTGLMC